MLMMSYVNIESYDEPESRQLVENSPRTYEKL
jgi:hypothetical protein